VWPFATPESVFAKCFADLILHRNSDHCQVNECREEVWDSEHQFNYNWGGLTLRPVKEVANGQKLMSKTGELGVIGRFVDPLQLFRN
jgi:hypothetical protein